MADIIDISNKHLMTSTSIDNPSVRVLKEVLKGADLIEDVLICVKQKDREVELFYTTGLDVKDKSYIIQLLQHDVFQDLAPTEDLDDEEDL